MSINVYGRINGKCIDKDFLKRVIDYKGSVGKAVVIAALIMIKYK